MKPPPVGFIIPSSTVIGTVIIGQGSPSCRSNCASIKSVLEGKLLASIQRLLTSLQNFWSGTKAAPIKVTNSAEFKMQVVDQDYAEYKNDPTNLRLCYHLAVSLFHLRDWTFAEYDGTPNWRYSSSLNGYQKDLESLCGDFGYIRDLANAVKHAELDPKKGRPSTQMVGLANTEVSSASFQLSGSGFQTRTYIVSETGPAQYVDFEKAADAVKQMWNQLFTANNWL